MNEWTIFSSRVKELLVKKGISKTKMAELVGITPSTASRYLSLMRVPNAQVIYKISKVLEVSADYLLGLSDNPYPHECNGNCKGETVWNVDEDGIWTCENCGVQWTFDVGGLEENDVEYCPLCGKRIRR